MSESNFFIAYGQIMSRSWDDPEYRARLLSDPKSVLAEAGVELPADATVIATELEPTPGNDFNGQLERWKKGEETGEYSLLVPSRPTFYDSEDAALSDALLETVAGGTAAATSCCCCPCCCCWGAEQQV